MNFQLNQSFLLHFHFTPLLRLSCMKSDPWNAWNFYFVSSYQETFTGEQGDVICPQFYKFAPKQDLSLDSLVGSFISVGLSCVSLNSQRALVMGEDRLSAWLVEGPTLLSSHLFPFPAGQQDRRTDLSHPIHADNCLLDPEANECWKEPPAYTFRDYRYKHHHLH